MKQFYIDIKLPSEFSEKFIKHIPEQHEQIESLMESGVIRSYGLSSDQSKLYMVLNADDNQKVDEILQGLKLFEYFDPDVVELMFYKEAPDQFPVISLN